MVYRNAQTLSRPPILSWFYEASLLVLRDFPH
jgi:hypothetical protein